MMTIGIPIGIYGDLRGLTGGDVDMATLRFPTLVAKRCWTPSNTGNVRSLAMIANRQALCPVLVPAAFSTLTVTFTVTSGSSGKHVEALLYGLNADGTPGALLATGTGALVTATGDASSVITYSGIPGWYWCPIVSDGTPTITCADDSQGMGDFFGFRAGVGYPYYGAFANDSYASPANPAPAYTPDYSAGFAQYCPQLQIVWA